MRRLSGWLAVVVLLVGAAGCGGDDRASVVPATAADDAPAMATKSLEYATWGERRTLTLDMYVPAGSGGWPVVVHFPGLGGGIPSWFPQDLVAQGVMVFVPDYPDMTFAAAIQNQGAGYRAMAESAACAIHYARARAADLGSDDPVVVVSGFSLGGAAAAHAALFGANLEGRWEEFARTRDGPPRQVDCETSEGSTQVDAFVGMAGAYDGFVGYDGKWGREWIRERDPALWQLLYSSVGEDPGLKVRLLHGDADWLPYENSVEFEGTLADAGYDVTLIPFTGGHSMPSELAVPTIMEVIGP